MRVALLLALAACAAPLRWQPRTPESISAQRIGGDLEVCLEDANGWPAYVKRCSHLAAAACLEASLPADCGPVALWWHYVGRKGARATRWGAL